jgi:gallate dioxygenase
MANIIGAIASSHTPTIGFALDANKQHDAVWAPIFKAYEPVRSGWPRRSRTSCW